MFFHLEAVFTQNERAEWPGITVRSGASPACVLCLTVPLLFDVLRAANVCRSLVSCVKLPSAVEGKLVMWDITSYSCARLYPASRRRPRPASSVICIAYRGRKFLRNIGIHLHGAWFDYLEDCSL